MKGTPTTLVFREGLTGSNWRAVRVDGAGAARRGLLADILEQGERVVLLLPGDDAVMRTIDLPGVRASERREAALSILEPELAETADTLALGYFSLPNKRTLAIWMSKSRLAAWLGAVSASGAVLVSAVPEWLLLCRERSTDDADVWYQADKAWLISKHGAGLCTQASLAIAAVGHAMAGRRCEQFRFHGAASEMTLTEFAKIPGYARGEAGFDWPALWNRVGDPQQMDIRRAAESGGQVKKPLPLGTLLAAVAFVCIALGSFVAAELNALEAERDRWDSNSVALFRGAFPDEGRVVDVKRQMKLKLRAAGGTNDNDRVTLRLLGGLAGLAEIDSDVQVAALQYESGRLVVSLQARALFDIEQLRAAAEKDVPELVPRLQQLVVTTDAATAELHLGTDQ